MKIKIFNREICVCALLATNSFMHRKQRRSGENYEKSSFGFTINMYGMRAERLREEGTGQDRF